jgi:short-subunit dehydrogenase
MKVKDKVIVVTGGGNGLGRELVLNLLSKGAKVITIDINESALQETVVRAGTKNTSLKTFVIDITNRASIEEFVDKAIAQYGFVDGIINNAGIIQPFVKLNDLSYEAIDRVINVNLYGTLYITKAFLPHLLSRPEGHIVNISSMGGFISFPSQTIYGAAKAAVKIFTEGLYAELKDTFVNVTVVHPGAITTNIMANSGLDKPIIDIDSTKSQSNMALSASRAAEIIIRAVERNKFRVTVGKDATFLDLMYRLNPRIATNFIGKMMKKNLSQM